MNDNNKVVVRIAVAILVVLVAGFIVLASKGDKDSMNSNNTPENTNQSMAANETNESPEASKADAVATTMVEIKDYAYAPAIIKVKVGDKVTWTNQDSVRHDVAMDDDSQDGPKSELLAKGESYSYTFTKAGTYTYHCTPHSYMKGTVVVE